MGNYITVGSDTLHSSRGTKQHYSMDTTLQLSKVLYTSLYYIREYYTTIEQNNTLDYVREHYGKLHQVALH